MKDFLFELNSTNTLAIDGNVSSLEIYKWFVAKEKAIYCALN